MFVAPPLSKKTVIFTDNTDHNFLLKLHLSLVRRCRIVAATLTASTAGMSKHSDILDFPLESKVILHGLTKSPDLNGKVGIVRSGLNDAGRQTVFILDSKRIVGLKPCNIRYEPRTVESLSAKELTAILRIKGVDKVDYLATDKSELQTKVSELISGEEEIPLLLAMSQTPSSTISLDTNSSTVDSNVTFDSASDDTTKIAQQADQLSNMSPETLRQQARMMKSMDPDSIRRMNPQLANMTDAQIRMAADQMEMMANNPDMMKMAVEQMKNMDPSQLQRMQSQMQGGTMPIMSPTTNHGQTNANGISDGTLSGENPSKLLANMDKDQLKQMLKTVKDNPEMLKQFAAMTGTPEEQLKQGMESFAGMSDDKMEAALKMMQTVAKAKEKWNQIDATTGGRLVKILIALAVLIVGLIVWYLFLRSSPFDSTPSSHPLAEDITIVQKAHALEEDEFDANEF
jgi:hypothetical protein